MNSSFQLCIFEDSAAVTLSPYQLTRPVYTLPNGMYNLVERLSSFCPNTPIGLLCQKAHAPFLRQRFPKVPLNQLNKSLPTLYINARISLSQSEFESMIDDININKNNLFIKNKTVIAVYATHDINEQVFKLMQSNPSYDSVAHEIRKKSIVREKKSIYVLDYWWQILDQFKLNICQDFNTFSKRSLIEGHVGSFTTFIEDTNTYVSSSATIHNYVSIDASKGPVVIMDDVTIKPFVTIEGPCIINANTTINSHADIGSSYIGTHCKIGGEVKNSIVQSYTNKGHHGYIGDSIIGEWVNIGAGTTTSNLKLSYGTVQTKENITSQVSSTDRQFLGTLFGDYVKTSIQSTFDCGSVIGVGSSLFGPKPHAKFIPPFTWGEASNYQHQNIDQFLTTLDRMMIRRNKSLAQDNADALKIIYDSQRQGKESS